MYNPWGGKNEDGGGGSEAMDHPELILAEEAEARTGQNVVQSVSAESRSRDDVVETEGGGYGCWKSLRDSAP